MIIEGFVNLPNPQNPSMASQEWEDRKEKRYSVMHSLYDYAMGVVWISVGLFFLLYRKLGIEWMKSDAVLDTIFGFVGVAYGIFRLYRGYQKKYFRK